MIGTLTELSILVPLKNRSFIELEDGSTLDLFPRCLNSIIESIPKEIRWEIIIGDFQSEDIDLNGFLSNTGIDFKILDCGEKFSRGLALNRCLAEAKYKYVFVLDADCSIKPGFWTNADRIVGGGSVFYPVPWIYEDREHSIGQWMIGSYGMAIFPRSLVNKNPYEEFDHYGYEDNALFAFLRSKTRVRRIREPNLLHNWHPDELRTKHIRAMTQEEVIRNEQKYAKYKMRAE